MNAFSTYQVAMHWFIAFAAIAAVASLFLQRGPFRGANEAKAQANG
jgi:cytochrome b561